MAGTKKVAKEGKSPKSEKKEKKEKRKTKEAEEETPQAKEGKAKKVKTPKASDTESTKKASKRKASEIEEAEEEQAVAASNGQPAAKQLKGAAAAEAATAEQAEEVKPEAEEDPMAVDNFAELSDKVKSLLRSKGILALFPIQAQTLGIGMQGLDVVGRARTGCGKTLAFVLPIIELLIKEWKGGRRAYGRKPSVIVLAPTRELAKQVHEDFEYFSKAGDLQTLCVYGGAPYQPQENRLRSGVDIIVGTPGRVKDHIERKTLDLSELRFRVLDECDEMLNMGFVEDVEKILLAGQEARGDKIQTFLYSATLPSWVKQITNSYLQPTHKVVDLVGNSTMKAATTVRHMQLPCHWTQRSQIVCDLVKAYGGGGRTIIFTDTKNDASELSQQVGETIGARALHGDIPQSQREITLSGFKSGKFNVLVATDVAARGLDVNGVELVIQTEPPKDPETYIHRSGRTGRAGSTGVSITLVNRKKEGYIPLIERKAGMKFERVGAPQPQDMAKIAATRTIDIIRGVDDSVVPYFMEAAQKLIGGDEEAGAEALDPAVAVAKAMAKICGHTELKRRSLMSASDDFVTLGVTFPPNNKVEKPGYVFGYLRRRVDEALVEQVKHMNITADEQGAVFDVPAALVKKFLDGCSTVDSGSKGAAAKCSILEELPALRAREQRPDRGGYSGGGRGFGRGSFNMGHSGGEGRGRGGRGSFGGRDGGRGGSRGGGRGFSGGGGRGGRGRGRW